jgi:hypothetical protein
VAEVTPLTVLLVALFFYPASLWAQSEKTPGPISTDRPSASAGPGVVPRFALQFEMGYGFGRSESQDVSIDTQGFPGLLLRFGVLETLEARLTMNGWSFKDAATGDESGFNDIGVGAKWAIVSENGPLPETSLLVEVNLPVGDPGFTDDFSNPKFLGLFTNQLSEELSLTYNFGATIIRLKDETSGERRVYELPYTVMLSGSLGERWGWFGELFGTVGLNAQTDRHSLQAGVTTLLNDVFQLDVRGGAGLVADVPTWLVGAGVGIRLFH